MANKIVEQKLIDSTKRALLKYVLVSDGTQEANTVLVDVSNLQYSLNTNGYIMSSNTDQKPRYRTTIKRVAGHIKSNGTIRLQWHATSNNEVIALGGTGPFEIAFDNMGEGAVIPHTPDVLTGDILVTTAGLAAGDVATIMIDLRKDNQDYDAGQSASPRDFNRF